MNLKTWLPLGLAIVLGLVAAIVGKNLIMKNKVVETKDEKYTTVAIVKGDVVPGQELTPEILSVGNIPSEGAPAGTFNDPAALAGRVAMTSLVNGQPVLEGFLAPVGTGSGLQALVPEGMRAITVEVDEFKGVAGMLIPGCHVDVIATIHDNDNDMTLARTIVEDVKVTAVGRRVGAQPVEEENGQIARSVTLLVAAADAEAIELAATLGRPRLVLRSLKDEGPTAGNGITLAELRGNASRKVDPFVTPVMDYTPVAPTTRPADVTPMVFEERPPMPTRRAVRIIRGGIESEVQIDIKARPARGLMTDVEQEPIEQ